MIRARRTIPPIPALALAFALVGAVAGCEGPARDGKLRGHTRPIPKQVGGVRLTEVRLGLPDTTFAFRAAPGGLVFTMFGFTNCPDLCPTTLGDLRKALRKLGSDAERVGVSFITVDPDRDTPEVMSKYLRSFFIPSHALRPTSPAELLAAQAAFGATSSVTRQPDGEPNVAHTTSSYVVDERGRVVVEWSFGTTPADMAADLRLLLARHAGETSP